jgi:hypothetical protein
MLQVTLLAVREGVTDVAVAKKELKRRGAYRPPSLLPRERSKGLTGQKLWDAVDRFAAKVGHPERVRHREKEG